MDDKLKPCPFCGGVAQRVDITADERDPNAGGSYIACQFCLASSSIAFGDKSSLVDNWNNRAGDARIRTEARAEAQKETIPIRDALERLYFMVSQPDFPIVPDKYYHHVSDAAAILAGEPKERGAGDMIEARVWENGEWRIEASSREAYKIDPRASFILVPVMSRAEVERKLKEAEE